MRTKEGITQVTTKQLALFHNCHVQVHSGRIERELGQAEAIAIVRDLNERAKPKVQTVLRRAGRTAETAITPAMKLRAAYYVSADLTKGGEVV